MERLNAGTKEIVSVILTDRLGTLSDLSPYPADFKVTKHDGTTQADWSPVTTVVGMRVDSLVNTTGWGKGRYKLYVRPTIGSEQPIVGGFDFDVV